MNFTLNRTTVRKLKKEDAEEIRNIHAKIMRTDVNNEFREVVEAKIVSESDTSCVAEFNGKIVGYILSNVLSGSFGMEKSAWIAKMGVTPALMGQGIGKLMVQKLCSEYRKLGIKHIYTSVRWYDTDLLSFFKTLEFDRSEFIQLRKNL